MVRQRLRLRLAGGQAELADGHRVQRARVQRPVRGRRPGHRDEVYDSADGGWEVVGGTSEATPLIAAYYALVGSAAQGPSWAYQNAGLLNDPSSGFNGQCSARSRYICQAGAGYDGPTGVGQHLRRGRHRRARHRRPRHERDLHPERDLRARRSSRAACIRTGRTPRTGGSTARPRPTASRRRGRHRLGQRGGGRHRHARRARARHHLPLPARRPERPRDRIWL